MIFLKQAYSLSPAPHTSYSVAYPLRPGSRCRSESIWETKAKSNDREGGAAVGEVRELYNDLRTPRTHSQAKECMPAARR